jgi:hypothetical protein
MKSKTVSGGNRHHSKRGNRRITRGSRKRPQGGLMPIRRKRSNAKKPPCSPEENKAAVTSRETGESLARPPGSDVSTQSGLESVASELSTAGSMAPIRGQRKKKHPVAYWMAFGTALVVIGILVIYTQDPTHLTWLRFAMELAPDAP